MKKYLKIILAAIVALLFVGTFVFLYMKSKPQPAVYDEFSPKVTDISKTTVITGTIEPRDEVEVKPQISGIITESKHFSRAIPEGTELPWRSRQR